MKVFLNVRATLENNIYYNRAANHLELNSSASNINLLSLMMLSYFSNIVHVVLILYYTS